MKIKSFILGLGAGILVMCLIFYLLYAMEIKRKAFASTTTSSLLDDDEIISRAKELGMTDSIPTPITDDEIIERASSLGMIWEAQVTDEPTNFDEDLNANTDDVFEESDTARDAEDTHSVEDVEQDLFNQKEPVGTQEVEPSDDYESTENYEDHVEYVSVTILPGSSLTSVANVLSDKGLIDSEYAFIEFVKQKNFTRFINAGTFSVRRGANMDEILRAIAKTYR